MGAVFYKLITNIQASLALTGHVLRTIASIMGKLVVKKVCHLFYPEKVVQLVVLERWITNLILM